MRHALYKTAISIVNALGSFAKAMFSSVDIDDDLHILISNGGVLIDISNYCEGSISVKFIGDSINIVKIKVEEFDNLRSWFKTRGSEGRIVIQSLDCGKIHCTSTNDRTVIEFRYGVPFTRFVYDVKATELKRGFSLFTDRVDIMIREQK
jgi:hypothetical protein